MKLREILVGIEGLKAKGSIDIEISSVECDYREVKQGSVFVAIKGFEVERDLYFEKRPLKDIDDKQLQTFLRNLYSKAI